MPWKEVSVVSARREFVEFASLPDRNLQELCRRWGISRPTGYKWLRRFAAEGPTGLEDRSRRPRQQPMKTAPAV